MNRFHLRALFCLLAGLSAAMSQTSSGRLSGLVTDTTGAVLPGANITIRSEKTGQERTVTANETGY
jgi:hypothetical protein